MGRMNCMKITLHLLALCLLLSITTKVSGKPNPRHLLIETEEQAKKTADYKEPGTDYNKAKNDDDYQFNVNFGDNCGQVGNTENNFQMQNSQMSIGGSHFHNNGIFNDQSITGSNIRGSSDSQTADYKEPGTDYNKAENDDDYQINVNFGNNCGQVGNTGNNFQMQNSRVSSGGTHFHNNGLFNDQSIRDSNIRDSSVGQSQSNGFGFPW